MMWMMGETACVSYLCTLTVIFCYISSLLPYFVTLSSALFVYLFVCLFVSKQDISKAALIFGGRLGPLTKE